MRILPPNRVQSVLWSRSVSHCEWKKLHTTKHTTATNTIERISALLDAIPMTLPTEDIGRDTVFRCRVWLKQAVRVLAANDIVNCPDGFALEGELFELGNENEPNTIAGLPYRLHVSRYST